MKVRINKDAWSEESKRSYIHESNYEFYEDIPYQCYKCKCKAIFKAEDQKETYEVKKRYIWQKRKLCDDCYNELLKLKKEIKNYEDMWAKESEVSKQTAPYLKEWLSAINTLPHYGKRKDHAKAQQLYKIINTVA